MEHSTRHSGVAIKMLINEYIKKENGNHKQMLYFKMLPPLDFEHYIGNQMNNLRLSCCEPWVTRPDLPVVVCTNCQHEIQHPVVQQQPERCHREVRVIECVYRNTLSNYK